MFKVRTYDASTDSEFLQEVDLDTIIQNPYGMHMNDIGLIAINELRRQKGLEPVPQNSIAEDRV